MVLILVCLKDIGVKQTCHRVVVHNIPQRLAQNVVRIRILSITLILFPLGGLHVFKEEVFVINFRPLCVYFIYDLGGAWQGHVYFVIIWLLVLVVRRTGDHVVVGLVRRLLFLENYIWLGLLVLEVAVEIHLTSGCRLSISSVVFCQQVTTEERKVPDIVIIVVEINI